ncbi:MAG: YbaK/EbsC family protein [Nitrososphaerota archaeon]|nr:YbaK/EbsC family protein [Nitrososphaerota archaeon]
MGPEDLKEFLGRNSIRAEVVEVEEGWTGGPVVKSVLFMDESGGPVLVVLEVGRKVRQGEFARRIGRRRLRLATREEVLEATGYPAGGVPPVGCREGLEVYVDSKVLAMGKVYAGGGSERHMLLFDPALLAGSYPGRVVDVPIS